MFLSQQLSPTSATAPAMQRAGNVARRAVVLMQLVGVLALSLVGVDAAASVTREQELMCQAQLPDAIARVTLDLSRPVASKAIGTTQISARIQNDHRPAGELLGLTEAAFQTTITVSVKQIELESGLICAVPSLNVRLSFSRLDVFLARELVGNRCAYDYVSKHEMTHVLFHREALEKTAAALERELSKKYPPGRRLYEKQADLQELVHSALPSAINERAKELYARFDDAHSAIDSGEEYRKTLSVCNGDIPRLVKAGSGKNMQAALNDQPSASVQRAERRFQKQARQSSNALLMPHVH